MLTPPPVSGQSYPMAPVSQERSNYLRGGVTFSSAYSDNVLGSTAATRAPVSDVSYSVWPTIALDETTTAAALDGLTYAPGFTFYQRTSARNEADQNASINFQYRLSPHVTFSAARQLPEELRTYSTSRTWHRLEPYPAGRKERIFP